MFEDVFGKRPEPKPTPLIEIESEELKRHKVRYAEKMIEREIMFNNYDNLAKHQSTYLNALTGDKECNCNICKTLFRGLDRGERMRELLSLSFSCLQKPEIDNDTISVHREAIRVENLEECKKIIERIKNSEKEIEVVVLDEINGAKTRYKNIVKEHHNRIPVLEQKYSEQRMSNGKIKKVLASERHDYWDCKTKSVTAFKNYTECCVVDKGFMGVYVMYECEFSFRKKERTGSEFYLAHKYSFNNKFVNRGAFVVDCFICF